MSQTLVINENFYNSLQDAKNGLKEQKKLLLIRDNFYNFMPQKYPPLKISPDLILNDLVLR